MFSLLACALVIHSPSRVTIPPLLRTYREVAQALSAGQPVRCGSSLGDRLCVVSLKDRELAQARQLVQQGLHVRFRELNGEFLVDEDTSYEALQDKLFSNYVGLFDARRDEVYREAASLWKANRIPSYRDLNELCQAEFGVRINDVLVNPEARFKHPSARLAGFMLLATLADDSFGGSTSAPFYFYFKNGGSIRRLIPDDQLDTGNAEQWSQWPALPAWARERATANLRQLLEKRAETASPGILGALVRDSRIVHRVAFDPSVYGYMGYEFGVLSDAESLQGWYRTELVFYLMPDWEKLSLDSLYESAGEPGWMRRAISETTEVLREGDPRGMKPTISEGALAYDGEVVCPVSLVRDREPVLVTNDGPYRLMKKDNVLFFDNGYSFLDSHYTANLQPYLEFTRAPRPHSLAEWLKFGRGIRDRVNGEASRCSLPANLMRLAPVHPFLGYLSAIPSRIRDDVVERLKKGEQVRLVGRDLVPACSSRFASSMREIFDHKPLVSLRSSIVPPYMGSGTAHLANVLPVSPRYEAIVASSVLLITPAKNSDGSWKLSLSLKYGETQLAESELGPVAL